MNLVTYRTTKEIALEQSDVARYDLVTSLSVPVDRKLDSPYESKRIRYRLQVDDRDPSEVFAVGPSQAIEPVDPNTAIATVYALRPGQPGNTAAPADRPTDGDRRPNSIVQSDNADIVALAERAAGDQKDAWQAALALEKFVKGYMTLTDYSQAFATAADVAKSRQGDCTEHSVLLAALARARGIPARVAIGLIYIEEKGQPAFGYHMWNEVYIDDRWIPLDATLACGGAGAARLKLIHSNMDGASALSCFLPVAEAAGRLKIEILEVR
jgi:transglutaminase-like putative cysteine protease